MTNDLEKTGNFIKNEREKKKLNQEQMAELLHVTASAVCKWETGKNLPDQFNLSEIARILECTIEELINGCRNVSKPLNSEADPDSPAPSNPTPDPEPELLDSASEQDSWDSASILPIAQTSFPESIDPGFGHIKRMRIKTAIVLLILFFLAISLIGIAAVHTPVFKVVDSFCGNNSEGKWDDNCYYIIVEFRGEPQENDFSEYAQWLKTEYLEYFTENIDQMVILYYRHYDSEIDSNRTMEYLCVFINRE